MPTTIKLKNSVTTTNAPSSLVQGEVAINITDKKVWVGNAASTPVQLLGDGGSASFTSIAFGAGTVSLPSITFTGDTNTGIYSPAADTIAFTEGGVESMRIDSSGNVGIGNTTPSSFNAAADNLVIGTTTGNNGITIVSNSANQGAVFFADGTTGDAQQAAGYLVYVHTSDYMALGTTNTERMRIDSSGNVGIGTNSPSTKLQLGGAVNQTIRIDSATGNAAFFGGFNTLTIMASNRNPNTGVFVDTSKASGSIFIDANNGVSDIRFNTTTSNNTDPTERMRITSGGDVGIGTNSPSTKIEIANGKLQVNTGGVLGFAGTGGINLYSGGGAEIRLYDNSNSCGINTVSSGGSSSLAFSTSGTTERMRIDANGLVGIGTNAPVYRLDITSPSNADTGARITGSGAYLYLSSTAGGGGGFSAVQGLDGSTSRWAIGNLGFTGSSYIGFYTGASIQQASINASGVFTANSTQSFGLSQYTNIKFMSFSYPPSGQFGANLDCTDISTPGNGSGLNQMRVTQQGNVGCRGAFSGGQTLNDYAEYFEWSDGNPSNEDRIGQTVVLDNGKVRPSTSQDAPNTIIGVVSATAGIVLGSAPFEWSGKYKRDDFGRILMQSETWISWTADNISHNYKQDEIPTDVVVPENAEVRTYQKEVLSDNYDESIVYMNRENRPEWACIGLVGQVHVKKGQVVGDRWIKMKDVSDNVEIWFIR